MTHLALADATDLTTWSGRIESQSTLPLLLRRLVHATAQDLTHVGFPAGDAVQGPGWDGITVANLGNAFIPAGPAVWEMGTNQDIKRKADEDYKKRTNNSLDVDPANTTFIFVTPRRWAHKDEWVRARNQEGVWREVRAYDADSLEEWLGLAPAVHLWISMRLGKFSDGAVDLGSWWLDWSERTVPLLTPQIVLAGRRQSQKDAETWIESPSPLTSALKAASRDEALAVFAATVMAMPHEQRVEYLSKAVVVKSPHGWHQLTASPKSLLLIPVFDASEAIVRAERNGHRVLIILGREDSSSRSTIEVPPVATDELRQELQDGGIPEDAARDLAALARRSFTSFRRKIARNPEFQVPTWAGTDEGPRLVPILLAGAWNAAKEGDREILSALLGAPYSDAINLMVRWATVSDPPIRSVGDTWYLVSKEDAWHLLSRYITRDHLALLERVVLDVFSATGPYLDMPPDERWRSTTMPSVSRHLRESLAETLAILASRDEQIGSTTGQEFVRSCAWQLLSQANSNWKIWATIPLTLLAEAAPNVFLEALEEGLHGHSPVVMNLFETGGSPMFSTSPHTYLLWALEVVAWSPEYLGQVTQILAKLSRLDPGGNTTNRPDESLKQIFLFWHAQTSASLEQRLQILNRLRRWEPDVAWKLFMKLLPGHSTGSNNPTPHWRDWAPSVRPNSYSRQEYYNGVCAVVSYMLEDAGSNGRRWQDLISKLGDLPIDQREKVIEALRTIDTSNFDEQALAGIWNALRRLISRHRSYKEAGWAFDAGVVDELEHVYHRFEPHDLVLRASWLFESRTELLEGREEDWEEHGRIVSARREQALRAMYEAGGIKVLLDLAQVVSSPWDLGIALGLSSMLTESDEDTLLCACLANVSRQLDVFGRGYVSGQARRPSENSWRYVTVARLWDRLSPQQQAHFLLQLPEDRVTFDLAETSPETEAAYWSLCTPRFVSSEDAERAICKLFEYSRPFTAVEQLDFMDHQSKLPSVRFVVEALQKLITAESLNDTASNTFSYHLNRLLTRLEGAEEVTEDELAGLEWALLPAMGSYGQSRPPKTLHRRLSHDPAFFVELVGFVYKPDGEEVQEASPNSVARAENSYALLESWNAVPGANEANNDVDAAFLMDWVNKAREGLDQSKRLSGGDNLLGKMLADAPVGPDGIWPHPAVREVIESVQSRTLEQAFRVGILNSRGVFSKSLDEGGAKERELAARYQGFADALRGSAPRTAAVLKRVAERYQGDARQEDQEAELREDLGW